MLLGAIADDLTGATDLALMLSREGMKTVQVVGVPPQGFDYRGADAVVVALKSRTTPAAEAVAESLAALARLQEAGARQIVFKYCSTFDSTEHGNIGPVTDALMDAMGETLTIVCPAFPANGRTIYQGYLFVGDQLLSDSPMKDHPLTPMRDSSLIRLMHAQSGKSVGLIAHSTVASGAAAVREALKQAREDKLQVLVVDAITDDDLREIGKAIDDLALITGGSGIAIGLPENFRKRGELSAEKTSEPLSAPVGRSVTIAGSCSKATRGQIETAIAAGVPSFRINPLEIASDGLTPETVIEWAQTQIDGTPLIYSSADPEIVRQAQERLGREKAGALVEDFLAEVASALRERGFARFLVAGGETSGSVFKALGVSALHIGPELDPGVPWTTSLDAGSPVALALKSGNFGSPDFFQKAWTMMPDY